MQGLRPLARLANNQVQNNVTEEFGPEHLILMEAPIPDGRRIAIGKFNFSAKDCKQLNQEQAGAKLSCAKQRPVFKSCRSKVSNIFSTIFAHPPTLLIQL